RAALLRLSEAMCSSWAWVGSPSGTWNTRASHGGRAGIGPNPERGTSYDRSLRQSSVSVEGAGTLGGVRIRSVARDRPPHALAPPPWGGAGGRGGGPCERPPSCPPPPPRLLCRCPQSSRAPGAPGVWCSTSVGGPPAKPRGGPPPPIPSG